MFVCNGFACCLRLSIPGRSLGIEGIFLLLLLCLLSVGCFSRSARFDGFRSQFLWAGEVWVGLRVRWWSG